MKNNNSILLASFLAALVAIVILPVGPAFACSALTFTGVLAIFLADYSRPAGMLPVLA
jgi:hypothetical protein